MLHTSSFQYIQRSKKMSDFELFPRYLPQAHSLRNKSLAYSGSYLSSNIIPDSIHDDDQTPSIPELLSLSQRYYYNTSSSSNHPIYGSTNNPFEIQKIEKVNYLKKSSPNSSHVNLKSLTSSTHRKKFTQEHKEIYLPPNFPSYCQYLRGDVKHS